MQRRHIQHSISRISDPPFSSGTARQLPDIPIELWLYIYDLVPHPHQRKMLWINRMLFQMIMSELHGGNGEAGLITSNPHVLSHQLRYLQSSILSRYIRVLTLRPASIRAALGTGKKPRQNRSFTGLGDSICRRLPSLPVLRRLSTSQLERPSPKKRVQMFMIVLRSLTQVDKFEIIWPYDTTFAGPHWEFFLFPEIWREIGRNLTKLSIEINVFKLSNVFKDCGLQLQLEELHLSLLYDTLQGHPDEALVPSVINKFASTLQHLSIKTEYRSYLFMPSFPLLFNFPRLNRLSINMPLDVLHLRDTSQFGRFILSHPNIEDLCIRCPHLYEDAACRELESVDASNDDIYNNISLPAMKIRTLELGLDLRQPLLGEDINESFYKNIARLGHGNNITTLILQDRIMEFKQIKTVLGLFPSHCLKELLLMACELSPELLDYLAETFPRLDSLSLHAQVLNWEARKGSTYVGPNAWEESHWVFFERALIKRGTNLTIKRFRTKWTLSDLSIMRYKQSVNKHVYDWKGMRTIADAVPSLRSFAGRGHMVLPDLEVEGSMPDVATKVKTRLDLQALTWYISR